MAQGAAVFQNLTVLDAATFKAALKAYADGPRPSGYMQPIAVQLSDAQVDGVTGWFARLPRRISPPVPASNAEIALGTRVAGEGLSDRKIAACDSCHDINRATAKTYPAIAGQNYYYLRDQLKLYRAAIRGRGGKANPMPAAAAGLSDAEIAAVAHYYAAKAPAAPVPVAVGARR